MRSQLLRHPKHSAVKSLSNVLSFFKSKTLHSGDSSFLFFFFLKKKLWESIVWALAVGISQSCVVGGVEVSCSNYYVINFFWSNKIWLRRAKWIKKKRIQALHQMILEWSMSKMFRFVLDKLESNKAESKEALFTYSRTDFVCLL